MIDRILKDIKGLFKVQDNAKFAKQNIPYLAFFYIGNIFSHHVRSCVSGDIINKKAFDEFNIFSPDFIDSGLAYHPRRMEPEQHVVEDSPSLESRPER